MESKDKLSVVNTSLLVSFHRVYIPCIYVLNKIDQISIEVRIMSVPGTPLAHSLPLSLPSSLTPSLSHSLPLSLPSSLTPSLSHSLPLSLPSSLTPFLSHSPPVLPSSLPTHTHIRSWTLSTRFHTLYQSLPITSGILTIFLRKCGNISTLSECKQCRDMHTIPLPQIKSQISVMLPPPFTPAIPSPRASYPTTPLQLCYSRARALWRISVTTSTKES